MNNISRPIGVFDSGVGGLSIYQELKSQLPNENFIYLADQKNAPYGARSSSQIRKLTLICLRFLLNPSALSAINHELVTPKLLVVACNTATVSGIEHYREKFPQVPIIGVVPVVKTAAQISKNNRIAILSTVATASSKYQADLISKFCPDYKVINLFSSPYSLSSTDYRLQTTDSPLVLNLGCPNLVTFIEKGITSGSEVEKELTEILKPVVEANCDTLILGCTHYPFLKSTIQKILTSNLQHPTSNFDQSHYNLSPIPYNLQVLDSAGAVARHVHHILKHNHLLNESSMNHELITHNNLFLTTGDPQKFATVIKKLIDINEDVEVKKANLS